MVVEFYGDISDYTKRRADKLPVNEIARAVYRQVAYILCGVKIEIAIVGTYHRRVGQTCVYHRIGVSVAGEGVGRYRKHERS